MVEALGLDQIEPNIKKVFKILEQLFFKRLTTFYYSITNNIFLVLGVYYCN